MTDNISILYEKTVRGTFVRRPNRFIAEVLVDDELCICHVKNTGRCRELLVPGACVILCDCLSASRKTRYDLVAVYKNGRLVNMDSQAPNAAAAAWIANGGLFSDITLLKREKTFGNSRFDIYCEHDDRRCFIEVKGVTLENDNIVSFPDAPTIRGTKHVNELIAAHEAGYEVFLLFVIQMQNVSFFCPNETHDPAFASALRHAARCGVEIIACDCIVTENSMKLNKPVPVRL